MPDTVVTIRVEENAKKRFDKFCEDVGINMSAAVNMFIYTVIREQKIPFEISSSDRDKSFKNLMESIEKIQKQSVENGLSDMTMEEIDAEIALARKERKERELLNV